MIRFLINLLAGALTLLFLARHLEGMEVEGLASALLGALVLGLVNAVIRPIILLVTLPINFLTLGLFTLVINALMVLLASALVPGFSVGGLFNALLVWLILSLVGFVTNLLLE